MTQLAFCSIAFRDEPIDQLWQRVAAIGYDAIEIFWGQLEGLSDDELKKLSEQSRQLQCPALVISPYLCFTRGKEFFDESIERLGHVVKAAGILGAKKIRTFVDVGPTGVASAQASQQQWRDGIEGLRMATEMAGELTFVLETHEKTLADCADGVRRIFDTIDPPNLKLLIHPAGGDDFGGPEGFRSFAPRIDHMHLNNRTEDGKNTWVEQGVFDYIDYFAKVIGEGYNGSVSVEYCWRGATWDNATSACVYLRKALETARGNN